MTNNWPMVPLGDIFTLKRRPVEIKAEIEYAEIGIYSFGRGIFHKPPRTGFEVGNKKLYLVGDTGTPGVFTGLTYHVLGNINRDDIKVAVFRFRQFNSQQTRARADIKDFPAPDSPPENLIHEILVFGHHVELGALVVLDNSIHFADRLF